MIRIINIIGPLTYGGIESLLTNYAKVINREEFTYDFLTCADDISDVENEILKTGSKVFHVVRKRKNILLHLKQLCCFLIKNRRYYDIVHVHMNDQAFIPLFLAKICGYKLRITHSHTSYINQKIPLTMKLRCFMTSKYATHHIGCSKEACNYLFGKNKGIVLNNCIDYDQYRFDEMARASVRNEYHLSDEMALVLVGRLYPEKNHIFLCDLLNRIGSSNIRMFFVGSGVEEEGIKEYIANHHLDNVIELLGDRSDVGRLLNGMDIFVMPSIHEGFPMVLLEAQANGLHCIVSDAVTTETDISDNIDFLPLKYDIWEKHILNYDINRNRLLQLNQNYDVKECVNKLMKLYKSVLESSYEF